MTIIKLPVIKKKQLRNKMPEINYQAVTRCQDGDGWLRPLWALKILFRNRRVTSRTLRPFFCFLQSMVFERLGTKRWLYMSVLCSVSERIHRNLPEEAHVLCHAFKNKNTFNQLKSSTSHFTKVSLHDFTDLLMKLAFYGGTKEHRWKGRNNCFISITVFS